MNNFPRPEAIWLVRLKEALRTNGAPVTVIPAEAASGSKFRRYDAVVLSGSFDMLSKESTPSKFAKEIEAVGDTDVPLLGVCFGHQLMAYAFGSEVVRSAGQTEKYVRAEVLREDPLFQGLSENPSFYESHYEEVRSLPRGFKLLSRSPSSPVNAMKRDSGPQYGVQFHPEKHSKLNPHGDALIANFLRLSA